MAGPFFFAWVDENQNTFQPAFEREDEDVFSFVMQHNESDIPQLTVEIKNPRIGLLAPGRKQWAWLSVQGEAIGLSGVIPLFFGRLVAIPNGVNQEIITIIFSARPPDYLTRKTTLANTLRVLPFWDPVFIAEDKRVDDDAVLEARSELWHVDRITHELTVSDILVGEDGTVTFTTSDVFYDSVEITLNQSPLHSVSIDASVSWTQAAAGSISLGTGTIMTATGAALIADWPKIGANLGGGWTVIDGSAFDSANITSYASDTWDGKGFNTPAKPAEWLFVPTMHATISLTGGGSGVAATSTLDEGVLVPRWSVGTSLVVSYAASRQRTEQVQFTLSTSVQPIVTLPDEPQLLSVSGADVGLPIDGVAPIGSVGRRSYFPTDRGLSSIEYLVCLGRAQLLARSRAVQVKWECPFDQATALSCRMNAVINDHRLPGGQAAGKIISYGFAANVEDGRLVGTVTIGCAIGYADAIVPVEGSPLYVAVGYVETGYQQYAGSSILLPSGDITYTVPLDDPDDDGLDLVNGLSRSQAVLSYGVQSAYDVQTELVKQAMGNISRTPNSKTKTDEAAAAIVAILEANPTTVSLSLVPVDNGPFAFLYPLETSLLSVPKMIDLEAAT